jgi:outer membrane lipoprotein
MRRSLRPALPAFVVCALAGCATPVFKDAPHAVATPAEIAVAPERYHDADVVWGGKILDVRNLAESTEVEVVAYPLDADQRPEQEETTAGRFIVALPGYVEPLDYPPGRFVTLRGRIEGTRAKRVDEHDVVLPIVADATVHLWPVNFPYEASRVHFSVGVGVGIH